MAKNNKSNQQEKSCCDAFAAELDCLIKCIEKIKALKRIPNFEDESAQRAKEELDKKNNHINDLNKQILELENKKREVEKLKSHIRVLEYKNRKYEKLLSLYLFLSACIILIIFALPAFGLLGQTIHTTKIDNLIPLLISGVSILLILGILIIVVGKQVKSVLDNKKDES